MYKRKHVFVELNEWEAQVHMHTLTVLLRHSLCLC